jgi:multidrug transporter EmrE-like cation transporter
MKELLLAGAIVSNVLTNIGFKYSALNEAVPSKKWGFLALGLVFGLINSVLFTETLRFMTLQVASTYSSRSPSWGSIWCRFFGLTNPSLCYAYLGPLL